MLFLALLTYFSAHAQDLTTYKVAVDENLSPLYSKENNLIALLEEFALQHKIKFNYVHVPYLRGLKGLKDNEIDFLLPDTSNQYSSLKEGMLLYYSDSIFSNLEGIITKDECPTDPRTLRSLGSIKRRYPYPFNSLIKNGHISHFYYKSSEQLFELLDKERIHSIFSTKELLKFYQKSTGNYKNLTFCKNLETQNESVQLSTTKWPRLLIKFNKFLKKRPHE